VTGPLPVVRRRVDAVDLRWRSQPLRTRLTAAAALSATIAIVAVVAVAYIAVRHELLSNIDGQLRAQASNQNFIDLNGTAPTVHGVPGQSLGNAQVVFSDGQHFNEVSGYELPVSPRDIAIVTQGGRWLRTREWKGAPVRILTVQRVNQDGQLVALQVALPLTAADSELHKLTLAFLLLVLLGLGMVTAGTWFVVRRTMRPVATLTEAAEQIAVTRDLTTRIESYSDDELGRLAGSFNTMLDALEKSLNQQRQLIVDASHELRTPLASLRTNVEVLHDVERLSGDQRRALLDGIVTQLDELTGLVADVVELARGDAPESAQEDVALDDLVSQAVERARRHWPNVIFILDVAPVAVRGVPARLDRAIANLLDNAGKFSPSGSVVDTTLTAEGVLTVADRGPGVPEEAVEFVFDRFYRADEARSMPGSGLGLAIVKQVIDGHHGTVTLHNRAGGGTIVSVTLSPLPGPLPTVPLFEAQVVDTQPVS
jgi:two-component system sensor histidine kinase MprB